MFKFHSHTHFSILLSLSYGTVGVLVIVYIGLIAMVMSYATLTIEFSQSVKNDEAVVAGLESRYLASIVNISDTNYTKAGYTKPVERIFVHAQSATALR